MLSHSDELSRCEAQLENAADAFGEAIALNSAAVFTLQRAVRLALADLLEQSIAQIGTMMPQPARSLPAERLWELSEIEDEFEVALAFHGWVFDTSADESPPLLTERLDKQA